MAHTIGKFQYLLIERTFLEGKQIDEYFELANSEKIAIAMAEDWERGYNATQIAPNVLRAEFDTGFGTTEVRELALLSVPVVTGISGMSYIRIDTGCVWVVVEEGIRNGKEYEIWRAYKTAFQARNAMEQIVYDYAMEGYEISPDDKTNPTEYKVIDRHEPDRYEAIIRKRPAKLYNPQ